MTGFPLRHWIVFPFFLFLLSGLRAQEIQFHFHDCEPTANEQWKIRKAAEYENAFFVDVFGARRNPVLRMHIYGKQKAFRFAQRVSAWRILSETGLYNPISNKIFVLKTDRFLSTSFHESCHALFDYYGTIRPSWLDEGLAEYFKNVAFDSSGVVGIAMSSRVKEMKKIVADSAFSIRKVLRASRMQYHGGRNPTYYTVGWGIVYFLETSNGAIFKKIVFDISKRGMRSEKAININYPGGVKQLENELKHFYQ